MSTETAAQIRQRPAQGGPPLGILAVVFAVLFIAGVAVSAAIAGKVTPSPLSDPAGIAAYFAQHRTAVRVGGFFQFGSAVPLAIYSATVSARLRNLGIRAPGATIAQVGGTLAAAFLALSGLLGWVLARPEVASQTASVRMLHDLSFMTGGVAHVVMLGLLIAGVAVPGLLVRLLPRPLAWAGLVIAVVCEVSTLAILVDGATYLLPVGRFAGMAWLIWAGFALPATRTNAGRRAG